MGVIKIKGGWRVYFTDENGKPIRHRLRGVTKDEADAYLAKQKQRVRDIKQGFAVRSKNTHSLTLKQVAEKYIAKRDSKLQSQVRVHLIDTDLGALPLEKVTSERIAAHLDALKPAPPKRQGQKVKAELSPRTKNHVRKHLRQIFSYAIERKHWLGENPVADVKPKKLKKKTLDVLSTDELVRVILVARPPWRGMLAVAAHGLRKGEIFGLDVVDVDLKANVLRVRRSHDGSTTKSGREREVPIHPTLHSFIKEAVDLAEGHSPILFAGFTKDGEGHARRHPDSDMCTPFRALLAKAKITRHLRFHDLRHTVATALLRSGVQVAHVSKILGHASVAITVDTYGHLITEDLHAAMAKLDLNVGPRAAEKT